MLCMCMQSFLHPDHTPVLAAAPNTEIREEATFPLKGAARQKPTRLSKAATRTLASVMTAGRPAPAVFSRSICCLILTVEGR